MHREKANKERDTGGRRQVQLSNWAPSVWFESQNQSFSKAVPPPDVAVHLPKHTDNTTGSCKKLVPDCEKSLACLQSPQTGDARLVKA